MKSDVTFLKEWLSKAKEVAIQLSRDAKQDNRTSIFTISSTQKRTEDSRPYLTPVRKTTLAHIAGAVVSSQTQAILLAHEIDGIVDQVFVDAEKKLGILLDVEDDVLLHFGIHPLDKEVLSRVPLEMGNLTGSCAQHITKSEFFEYKANDITVEAAWHLLSKQFRSLSGKKITIIGAGNIGFKLGMKLVESGVNVQLVRRDIAKGMMLANIINLIKPPSTVATANYNSDPLQASLFCDALIGATDGVPAITWDMIRSMKKGGMVMDIGKGSIHGDAIEKSLKDGITIIRCDVTSALDGAIATIQRTKYLAQHEVGRKELESGMFVVSGGSMGMEGDIIVDNYQQPTRIIGVADGQGDIKKDLSQDDLNRQARLKDKYLS